MSSRIGSSLLILLGLMLAGMLLLPRVDPDLLLARGVAQLLADDAAGAGSDAMSPGASIFRALEGTGQNRVSLALLRHPRLERLEDVPAFRRAFDVALNVYNAGRVERGLRRIRVSETADGAGARLEIAISERGGSVSLRGIVRQTGRPPLQVRPRGDWRMPTRAALLPPIVAILIALVFKRTIPALLAGVWVGAIVLRLESGSGWAWALATGAADVPAVFLYREIVDSFRLEIIGFVFALVAMVGVMTRGAAIQGLVDRILLFARDARSTLAVSFTMGLSIFFDDYSNCLIVGNTMRPLTDRLRISREKLSYIVDSTAAPVAGLSILSTWVVFEVSTFSAQLPGVGITENPYAVFLQTLPYRFYCLFALLFVLLNILTGRDFGPMLRAERRAAESGEVVRSDGSPMVSRLATQIEPSPRMAPRARNAVIPIVTVIVVTIEEIFRLGGGYSMLVEDASRLLELEGLTGLLHRGGGTAPLFVAACTGWAISIFLVGSRVTRWVLAAAAPLALLVGPLLAPRLVPVAGEGLSAYLACGLVFAGVAAPVSWLLGRLASGEPASGLAGAEIRAASVASGRALGVAVAILFGAWMIGSVCRDVRTADYLVALSAGTVTPSLLPLILFGAACVVSFATGTSWGTMSILLPNVVALAAALGEQHALGSFGMVLLCIGAVLEGSIFGDHCSPISDTTVLSSVATASDHLDHVRTQAPYAVTVAAVVVVAGYLPTLHLAFWPLWLALVTGGGLMLAVLFAIGRRPLRRREIG